MSTALSLPASNKSRYMLQFAYTYQRLCLGEMKEIFGINDAIKLKFLNYTTPSEDVAAWSAKEKKNMKHLFKLVHEA